MEDGDANDYFASLGSDANAFTTFDHTNYEVWTASNLKDNLSYLLKYVLTPYYTKELVEKEKGIILEEAKRCLDNIHRKLSYAVNENLFQQDNRKYPVIGTIPEIEAITLEDIETAYNYFYKPYNMVLAVFGNVDPKEVVSIVKDSLKDYKYEYKEIEYKEDKEQPEIKESRVEIEDKNEVPLISINYKIPIKNFTELFKEGMTRKELDIATYILVSCELSSTSDFYEYLRDNKIIIGGMSNYCQLTDDYLIYTSSANSNNPDKYIEEIKNKIKHLNINEEDFERKKRSSIAKFILIFDNINDYSRGFSHEFISYGNDMFIENEVVKNMKFETVQKIQSVFESADKIVSVIAKKES
jgi:predicted Zn-dependent peptidase